MLREVCSWPLSVGSLCRRNLSGVEGRPDGSTSRVRSVKPISPDNRVDHSGTPAFADVLRMRRKLSVHETEKDNSGHSANPTCVISWILELEDVCSRLQTVLRQCRPCQRTALLVRQPCARQVFGNCQLRVDSRFCRAHPYMDTSRRRDSHSTLEGRRELGRPFERSPRSASNTS
jgi:hypothetical protein